MTPKGILDYRSVELDVLVPEAGIGTWQGPNGEEWITSTYPLLEGEFRRWSEPNEALAEDFVADALLANWNVIGLESTSVVPPQFNPGTPFH